MRMYYGCSTCNNNCLLWIIVVTSVGIGLLQLLDLTTLEHMNFFAMAT